MHTVCTLLLLQEGFPSAFIPKNSSLQKISTFQSALVDIRQCSISCLGNVSTEMVELLAMNWPVYSAKVVYLGLCYGLAEENCYTHIIR